MRCLARSTRRIAAMCAAILSAWPAESQQIRDSASVRIVSYARQDKPRERWTLDSKPLLQIGGADDGPSGFAFIKGVVRLSDGSIAVANQRPSEIRIFDASGRFVRSLGRNGTGPGEFNRVLFRLLRSGDTLIGSDNSMRDQVFAPNGELARSLARARPPSTSGNPARIAFDARGGAVVQATEVVDATTPSEADVFLRLFREASNGENYAFLLRVFLYRPTRERGVSPRAVVFGPSPRITADASRICIGNTADFVITCHDSLGRPLVVIRRAVPSRAITEADRKHFQDGYLAANKGASAQAIATIKESNRLTQFAERAPAFGRAMLSTSGDLWVSEFDPSEESLGQPSFQTPSGPLRCSVFAGDGTWLSDIVLPPRFRPFEVGADYVIGVSLDGDDVERVTLYRIRR
jgi:6-bladed beta-propeller protein